MMGINKEAIELFCDVYECKITHDTNKKIIRSPQINFSYTRIDDIDYTTVPIIDLSMPKDKFEKFTNDYQNYVDILNQLDDPQILYQLEQLLILVKLKK